MSIQNALRTKMRPLAATAPTNSLSAYGQNITPPPVPLYQGGNTSIAALQQYQNAANQANNTRYGQGLGVLTGGNTAALGSIQQAIADSNSYGQAAQQKLNLQFQNALGQQAQSAVSRGLADTTIADTMKDLPTRQYNDASAQITEMAANRRSGLDVNAANLQNSGANSIANYIASRNDVGPNASLYASLAQKAASTPRGTLTGASVPSTFGQSDFMAAQGRGGGGGGAGASGALPNTSNGGGFGSATGGGGGGLYFGPSGGGLAAGGSGNTGYQGGSTGGTGAAQSQYSPIMSSMGYGQGTTSITPSQPAAPTGGPISSAIQPASSGTTNPAAPAAATKGIPTQGNGCPWYDQMTGSCPGTQQSNPWATTV